jgi:hypothetical protein
MEPADKSNLMVVIGNFDSVRQRRRIEVAGDQISRACDLFVGELRLASLYFKQIAITPQHFIDGPMFLELGPSRLLGLVGRQSSSLHRELPITVFSQADNYEAALRAFIDRPNPNAPGNLYPMEFACIRRGTLDRREFATWLGEQKASGRDWDDPVETICGLIVEFSQIKGLAQIGKAEAERLSESWRSWIEADKLFIWQQVESFPKVAQSQIDEAEYKSMWKGLSNEGRACLEQLRKNLSNIGRSQQRSFVRSALSGKSHDLANEGDVINDWYDSLLHRVFAQSISTSYKEIVEKSFFDGTPADARLERAGWKSKVSDGFLPLRLQDGWLNTLAVMPVSRYEELNFDLRAAQSDWWEKGDELSRQRINLTLNQAIALENLSRKRWAILAKLLFAGISIAISIIDAEANLKLTWLAALVGILLLLPDVVDLFRILPWAVGGIVTSGNKRRTWSRRKKK